VVFEGRVERQEPTSIDIIDVLNDPHAEGQMRRTVFFTVIRTYRGSERQQMKVTTGWGGGDCGFDFETGKEYLVYAAPGDNGDLETGICSSTKSLQDAGPELRVLRDEPPSPEDLLTTDAYYKRKTSKMGGLLCGRVTDVQGKPLNAASLELIPIRSDPFVAEADETRSDSHGTFCFKGVDTGKFLLSGEQTDQNNSILKGFYPGVSKRSDAKAIEVDDHDTKLSELNFVLHDQPVHTLRFRIVNAINRPMPSNLQVMLIDSLNPSTADYHETSNVNADGTAMFESVPEGHYFATVFLDPDGDDSAKILKRFRWKTIREELDVNGEMQEVVLTLIPRD
jgi:hypothetical protein